LGDRSKSERERSRVAPERFELGLGVETAIAACATMRYTS
jgi:hypothetical protein